MDILHIYFIQFIKIYINDYQKQMHWKNELKVILNVYLNIFVNVPRSLFSIIHWFHCSVSQANNVATCKHPWFTGLHSFWIHFWEIPPVKFYRTQGFFYWKKVKDNRQWLIHASHNNNLKIKKIYDLIHSGISSNHVSMNHKHKKLMQYWNAHILSLLKI